MNAIPAIITQQEHNIFPEDISPNALKVLSHLRTMGHEDYLVGGGVRDLLLSRRPKDFDVVTDLPPQEIRHLFRNSRLIGRRFRLVHVYFRNEIIEVSTFRANVEESFKDQQPGLLAQDNTYGTIEEDAWRRDFTVNALYYNVADSTVIDYVDGMEDLHRRVIRIIGDPEQRFHEDPVRLLRAIRLAAKLEFTMDPKTHAPLLQLHNLLQHVPSSRLFDEILKLFFEGSAYASYQCLKETGYMQALFPEIMMVLTKKQEKDYEPLVILAMYATDERFANQQSLNPGFLLGILLWPVVQQLLQQHFKKHKRLFPALHHGINLALEQQLKTVLIPRRLTIMMRSVWTLQYHLERRRSKRIFHVFYQRYFRAAFDFLALRAEAGEPLQALVDWWQLFQDSDKAERQCMIQALDTK